MSSRSRMNIRRLSLALLAGISVSLLSLGILLHLNHRQRLAPRTLGAVLLYIDADDTHADWANDDAYIDKVDKSWKYRTDLQARYCYGFLHAGFLYERSNGESHLWVWIPHWAIITAGATGAGYWLYVWLRPRPTRRGFQIRSQPQCDADELAKQLQWARGEVAEGEQGHS